MFAIAIDDNTKGMILKVFRTNEKREEFLMEWLRPEWEEFFGDLLAFPDGLTGMEIYKMLEEQDQGTLCQVIVTNEWS